MRYTTCCFRFTFRVIAAPITGVRYDNGIFDLVHTRDRETLK